MRSLLALLACLMLVATTWGGAARAQGLSCSETMEQVAVHGAADCDEVPADADKNYPHCHTGCHGHHVAAPVPSHAPGRIAEIARGYSLAPQAILTGHQPDRSLRPPRA